MSSSTPKEIFRQLVTIRKVEELLLTLFSRGLLKGTVHTCIGQEACAVGVISAINKDLDLVCSNHRGHGHFIAYCDEVEGLISEIMGRPDGVCGGIGGSQHLHVKGFYSNGILGGMSSVAVGMAIAEKMKETGAIAVVFMGDGSLAEGNVYEAFNMASLWKAPVLFVVEHNQYAQSTHFSLEHAGVLSERAKPFGITTTVVDGNNVVAVSEAAQRLVSEIRNESTPQLLFLETYRLAPHSKGDDLRSSAEIEERRSLDPILHFSKSNANEGWLTSIVNDIDKRISSHLEKLGV